MKKVYIKPNILVLETFVESLLDAESIGQLGGPDNPSDAKGHNSFFDGWNSFDEEQSDFTNKSQWED